MVIQWKFVASYIIEFEIILGFKYTIFQKFEKNVDKIKILFSVRFSGILG